LVTASDAHPVAVYAHSVVYSRNQAAFPEEWRAQREAHWSPLSSANVTSALSPASTRQCVFTGLCLIEHRYNFIFTL
jgi:hypothetical protein